MEPLAWRAIRELKKPDDRPHHVANIILRRSGVKHPPVSVNDIARRLGVEVLFKSNPGWEGAMDSTIDPPVIWVNSDNHPVRQRFTVGHELGHILLHPLGQLFRDRTFAEPGDRLEHEANEFAAAILMPLWLLEPIVTSSRRSPKELVELFNVS